MTKSSIEWTDEVWNPVRGCSRVSSGCDNCYAMRQAHRFDVPGGPYEGLTTLRKGRIDWVGTARFVPEMLSAPLKRKKPTRWFVNSMSDLFHHDVTFEQIAAVFGVMAACPQHTFQILTKRPERMLEWFDSKNGLDGVDADVYEIATSQHGLVDREIALTIALPPGTTNLPPYFKWPLPNVHLGVSAENQATADERIPLLLRCPAAVHWVSLEPLLGSIRLREDWLYGTFDHCPIDGKRALNLPSDLEDGCEGCSGYGEECAAVRSCDRLRWVVVGGESGPGSRPCNVDSVRSIVEQCKDAGVACYVKQVGAKPFVHGVDTECLRWPCGFSAEHREGKPITRLLTRNRKGGDPSEWPEDLRVRELPDA